MNAPLTRLKRLAVLAATYKNPAHWIPSLLWRLRASTSSLPVVFVLGAPRSGTTLLQNILSSHGSLFTIEKETGLFSYQNLFAQDADPFGLGAAQTREIRSRSRDVVAYFDNSVTALMDRNPGKTFVEKTPQHVNYLGFILAHFPRARVVHIVRDGRDCYCSARRHPGVIPQAASLEEFAAYWKKCVQPPMEHGGDPRLTTIRYEELVSDPEIHVRGLMGFLGLSFERQQIDPGSFGDDARASLAHFELLGSPITAQRLGVWQHELTEGEKRSFLSIVSPELQYYGY